MSARRSPFALVGLLIVGCGSGSGSADTTTTSAIPASAKVRIAREVDQQGDRVRAVESEIFRFGRYDPSTAGTDVECFGPDDFEIPSDLVCDVTDPDRPDANAENFIGRFDVTLGPNRCWTAKAEPPSDPQPALAQALSKCDDLTAAESVTPGFVDDLPPALAERTLGELEMQLGLELSTTASPPTPPQVPSTDYVACVKTFNASTAALSETRQAIREAASYGDPDRKILAFVASSETGCVIDITTTDSGGGGSAFLYETDPGSGTLVRSPEPGADPPYFDEASPGEKAQSLGPKEASVTATGALSPK